MNNALRFILLSASLMLAGCSGIQLEESVTTDEAFEMEKYFQGETRAHGILLDRSGLATRHFVADLIGSWDDEKQLLTLDENFVFDDGEKSHRQWRITRHAAGEYTGKADDVEGTAIGQSQGNTLLWRYVLNIPYKDSTIAVNFEDWMYLSEGVLTNRAVMRKFGIKVGEVLISFQRPST